MSPDAAGPAGTLVLVVGPSGAGKDTLIARAKATLADLPVSFPRRIVTRPSSEAESHDSLSPEQFAQAATDAAFAIQWQAHGLDYAIPIAVEDALRRGDTVVCNVSRAVVPALRDRYAGTCVIYVDAPLSTRMQRIDGRGGRRDAPDRARRFQAFRPEDADVVIDNGGCLDKAVRAFVTAIKAVAAEPRPDAP